MSIGWLLPGSRKLKRQDQGAIPQRRQSAEDKKRCEELQKEWDSYKWKDDYDPWYPSFSD
jgi:hypothetical protein